MRVHPRSSAANTCASRFPNFVGGAHAARRKWSTSIVGGDFTVSHRERQTIAFRVALLHVVNTSRISLEHCNFIRRSVLDPVSSTFPVRLSEHDVSLGNRLLHFVLVFGEIDV